LQMPGRFTRLGLRSLATVKTSISLKDRVYKFGIDKANTLFSENFSAYIGFLICRDMEHQETPAPKKDNKILSVIEQILEM
jgi:hypothetical protein